jgi:hypothetical protein
VEIALDVTRYKRTRKALQELRREYRKLEERGGTDEPNEGED